MTDRRIISTPNAPAPMAPYNQAIVHGDLVFCSGAIGTVPATGSFAAGGAAEQAAQALDNAAAVLEAAGSGLDRALKTTIFLVDMADFPAVNEVYRERMPEPHPARTTVAVQALPRGALVEIEVIAAVRQPS